MLLYLNITIPFILTLLALLPQHTFTFQFRGVQINVTDYRVRATATYTLYLDRSVDSYSNITAWDQVTVNVTDNVTVIFPNDYGGSGGYGCQSVYVD